MGPPSPLGYVKVISKFVYVHLSLFLSPKSQGHCRNEPLLGPGSTQVSKKEGREIVCQSFPVEAQSKALMDFVLFIFLKLQTYVFQMMWLI